MNIWYQKLNKDLKQSKYNLKKNGLYVGRVKFEMEALLYTLKLEKEYSEKKDDKNLVD